MNVFVVPASPKTGQATIQSLLDHPSQPHVTGVYRDLGRIPARFKDHPRFRAIKGDVADVSSLKFAGADVIVSITPPQYSESKPITRAREMAANVKFAISRVGCSVKRLVYVSSIGAHLEHGTGEIRTNYEAEQALIGAAPEVVFIRCAYFMENWAAVLENANNNPPHFSSVLCPIDYAIPMVSVKDVGRTCAKEALAAGSPMRHNPYIFNLHGPESYSTKDVHRAVEDITYNYNKYSYRKDNDDKVELRLVENEQLEDFFAQLYQPPTAQLFVEMTRSLLPGGIVAGDMREGHLLQRGSESLSEVIRDILKK
ncbi:hypothetical protein BDP81DRAFT_435244 [Colletotrichum phormii]|uniref:NAD(P)-binding domain-containing protein n=1 Tax=Colletotrichum phormii TaxID=359342 RepID=A0AAI9ZJE7_9PEZI|nr:uncharacterized protein BDP81DRAFT_435244 [Colletotrichum phormii]KAK1625700.1 hypothetical protein BDP81DRAFT_435244 [Colletotrichum phormii]